jgi:hypothetical protein
MSPLASVCRNWPALACTAGTSRIELNVQNPNTPQQHIKQQMGNTSARMTNHMIFLLDFLWGRSSVIGAPSPSSNFDVKNSQTDQS